MNKKEFYSKYLNNPVNRMFFENTLKALEEGKIVFQRSLGGKYFLKKGFDGLIFLLQPHKNSTYSYFFDNYTPLKGEYLVTTGQADDKLFGIHPWLLLTNYRILQRDGKTKQNYMIPLYKIKEYIVEGGMWTKKLTFKMEEGNKIICEKVETYAPEELLIRYVNEEEWIQNNVKPSESNVHDFNVPENKPLSIKKDQTTSQRYCSNCGEKVFITDNFCPQCGYEF